MISVAKKVCMVGPFAVGKTSLVRRYVESIFSDKYRTTIGVKISKKTVTLASHEVQLMVWDIEGVDVFTDLKTSYLRGAAGVILVVDGSRPETHRQVGDLVELVRNTVQDIPMMLMINKSDLVSEWKVNDEFKVINRNLVDNIFETSAKSGQGVEEAFDALANAMCSQDISVAD